PRLPDGARPGGAGRRRAGHRGRLPADPVAGAPGRGRTGAGAAPMSPQLPALLLVGLGLYLVTTSLPFGAGRPPLGERLRRWDVDALVSRRRTGRRGERRLLPWAAADAVLRPLLEDLAEPVRGLLG